MAKVTLCPQCKTPTKVVRLLFGRTSYCLGCGWNCEAAKIEVRSELLSAMAVLTLSLVLAGFVWFKNAETHWMAAAILVAALAVPLCNGVPAYRHLRQLKSLKPPKANLSRYNS